MSDKITERAIQAINFNDKAAEEAYRLSRLGQADFLDNFSVDIYIEENVKAEEDLPLAVLLLPTGSHQHKDAVEVLEGKKGFEQAYPAASTGKSILLEKHQQAMEDFRDSCPKAYARYIAKVSGQGPDEDTTLQVEL